MDAIGLAHFMPREAQVAVTCCKKAKAFGYSVINYGKQMLDAAIVRAVGYNRDIVKSEPLDVAYEKTILE